MRPLLLAAGASLCSWRLVQLLLMVAGATLAPGGRGNPLLVVAGVTLCSWWLVQLLLVVAGGNPLLVAALVQLLLGGRGNPLLVVVRGNRWLVVAGLAPALVATRAEERFPNMCANPLIDQGPGKPGHHEIPCPYKKTVADNGDCSDCGVKRGERKR